MNPLKDYMLGVCRSLAMERINRSDVMLPDTSANLLSNPLFERVTFEHPGLVEGVPARGRGVGTR